MSDLSSLESFANTEKFFRKAVENGGISDVVRLPQIGNLPLRFHKTVQQEKSSLVRNEIRILEHCTEKKLNRVVAMFDYNQKLSLQQITTISAGVDLSKWHDIKAKIINEHTVISDIFYNPLFLIAILKNSLLALKQIHQNDIIHCDIKLDNICLPFDGYDLEKGRVFKPLFDNISLIDFGHSHWIGNSLGNSQRCWLGYIENERERYQSKHLIGILKQYAKDNAYKTEKYDNSSLDLINYSCDLYSLGVAFKSLDNRMLSQYSQALKSKPWVLIWQDYQSIIHQLLSYDNGIPSNEKSLPHQSMINKTELLIDKLERYMEYRYQDVKLQFVIDDAQQTPIANSKQKLQSDTPISDLSVSNGDVETENDGLLEELSFWRCTRSKNTISAYTEYVARYPKGIFIRTANDKIDEILNDSNIKDKSKVFYKKILIGSSILFLIVGGLKILGANSFKLPIATGEDIAKVASSTNEAKNGTKPTSTPNILDEIERNLVDYSQFKLIRTINVSSSSVQDLDFSPDNQYIVIASDGIGPDYHGQTPTLSNMIFRVDTGEKVKEFEGGNTGVVYAPNSKIIATASSDESMIDNKISIYSIKKDDVISEYPSESYLSNLGFSANGNYLAYGEDNSVVVKNTLSDENITISDLGHLFSFVGEDYPNMIAVVGSDINIIDLNTRKVIFNVPAYYYDDQAKAEADAPSMIRFTISPNGRVVATVDNKNTLRVGKIDFINGSFTVYDVIKSDYPDELILGDLIFTPNGLHLMHKNHKSLDVYRVSDMKKTASISIPENTWSVDISSDGKYIAVGTGHPKGQVLIYGVK